MPIFTRKSRSHNELAAERTKIIAEKAEARKKLDELVAGRRDVELYGELDDLQRQDADISRQKLLIDRAAARLWQIDQDEWALAAEAEQARRQVVYDGAQKAHAEGKSALRDYERYAASAADALKRYADAKTKIDAANHNLPDGKGPLADPEPSNEQPLRRDTNGFPLRSAEAHQSVLTRAVLPKLGTVDEFYFGKIERTQTYWKR